MRLLITYIAYFTLISRSVLLYLVLITHEAFEGRGESSSLTLLDWCNYVTMYKEQPCTYSLVVDGCCTRFVDVESGILIINFRGEIETLVGFDVRSCTWILGGSFKANGWMVERLYGGVWCFFFLFFFASFSLSTFALGNRSRFSRIRLDYRLSRSMILRCYFIFE